MEDELRLWSLMPADAAAAAAAAADEGILGSFLGKDERRWRGPRQAEAHFTTDWIGLDWIELMRRGFI